MTPDEARYEEYMDQLYEEHKEQAIQEFIDERLQSYYGEHRLLAESAFAALTEAKKLIDGHASTFRANSSSFSIFIASSLPSGKLSSTEDWACRNRLRLWLLHAHPLDPHTHACSCACPHLDVVSVTVILVLKLVALPP